MTMSEATADTSLSPLFPIGQMGFATHPIDRAAHLRDDAEKLRELENRTDARAYVIDRDSIVLKSERVRDSTRPAVQEVAERPIVIK